MRDVRGLMEHLRDEYLNHSMGFALTRATVMARRAFIHHIQDAYALRPVEFSLLMLLLGNANVAPKQLSTALLVPAPNMTPLLGRLQKRGLLSRERSQVDGRSQNIVLTEEGRSLAERAHQTSLTMEKEMLGGLSAQEQRSLRKLLGRVR